MSSDSVSGNNNLTTVSAIDDKIQINTGSITENLSRNPNEQADYIKKHPIPVQDSTSDRNKIINSIVQGLLTGSAGAAVGAITSNSGNITVDVVNSTTSAMAQSRPKVDDPDVAAAEAKQDPIRKQNLLNNSHAAITVVTNQNNYSSEGAFMTALYQALNPSDTFQHIITPVQANKVKEVIANKSSYSSDNDYANALNNAFRNVSK